MKTNRKFDIEKAKNGLKVYNGGAFMCLNGALVALALGVIDVAIFAGVLATFLFWASSTLGILINQHEQEERYATLFKHIKK